MANNNVDVVNAENMASSQQPAVASAVTMSVPAMTRDWPKPEGCKSSGLGLNLHGLVCARTCGHECRAETWTIFNETLVTETFLVLENVLRLMEKFSGFATKSLLGDYKRVEVLVLHLLLFVVVSWETDACKSSSILVEGANQF
ncbi:hypothetical protein PanWU01x14_340480 [Parasponia andersonii]|uniref:Uncharacterized protein n=1 Tax=Parasponia andersonii TaxID=3476 RepID=A0A2P5AEE1_PARAD|nr:hypothetical protein PanWU01x14_340480 [Parasponia andersonii]